MHLCDDCIKNMLQELSVEEQAIILYIYLSNREKDKAKEVATGLPMEYLVKIAHSTNSIRRILYLLLRVGIIKRKRVDHTWFYSLTRDGVKVASLIKEDENKRNKVNAFYQIGKVN